MRYLLQFPSEAQVRDYIIDQLEGDEPSDYIKFEKFEPFMLNVLMTNEYEPNPPEHLLAAFRVLDPEGKGYIRMDVMEELLTTKGIPLRTKEIESFKNFAVDKTGQYLFYEDYVSKLVEENERHKEFLIKDYENFKPQAGAK
uniref:EF-hand domain-containing protein n=1 Tax=Strombidium rassoulzadegani TaxID=1082188 RepID=A0A7S3CRX2_9SPIT|mmetsp:Transcript_3739/g.6370  ORF Transcript_3739/g.6370 Transcript_3739/m.6370 type:complete len:142 (+) Transcript_3739:157-582(+)